MFIKYVGLDTHKDTIAVAIADTPVGGKPRFYGEIANTATGNVSATLLTHWSKFTNPMQTLQPTPEYLNLCVSQSAILNVTFKCVTITFLTMPLWVLTC